MRNRIFIVAWSLFVTTAGFAVEYGIFSEEELLLSKLSTRSYELRENDYVRAIALIGKINRQFKAFVDATQHDFSQNLSKNRMCIVPPEPLNANDVTTDAGTNYILFALPRDLMEASLLFEAAMQKHTILFVSLLESFEARDKFNNFWQQEKLSQIKTRDNWTFEKIGSTVIGKAAKEPEGTKEPQIIETTIQAHNTITKESRILTHLHYESWRDRQATPSESLFQKLLTRIDEIQEGSNAPFAINCHGGVGRTGVVALSHYLRQIVKNQIGQGKKANEVTINIPRALFALRMQRDGLLESATQLASIYSILGSYVAKNMQPPGIYPIVPKSTPTPPADDPYYTFPDYSFTLSQAKQRFSSLQKNDSEGFDLLNAKIHIAFSKFGKCKKTDDSADSHHYTIERIQPRPTATQLNSYDIQIDNTVRYMLLACPRNSEEVATLYDALLEKEGKLIVSLLKTNDSSDRMNTFWKKDKLPSVTTCDGWTVTPRSETVLALGMRAQIVETELEARKDDGQLRTLIHLHYDGWLQDGRMPDTKLFQTLLDRMEEIQGEESTPIAFHSKWGAGRCGVAAISHFLRKEVQKELKAGTPLDDIRVNIAKTIFYFRRQRSGLVTHSPLLVDIYALLAEYYEILQDSFVPVAEK